MEPRTGLVRLSLIKVRRLGHDLHFFLHVTPCSKVQNTEVLTTSRESLYVQPADIELIHRAVLLVPCERALCSTCVITRQFHTLASGPCALVLAHMQNQRALGRHRRRCGVLCP